MSNFWGVLFELTSSGMPGNRVSKQTPHESNRSTNKTAPEKAHLLTSTQGPRDQRTRQTDAFRVYWSVMKSWKAENVICLPREMRQKQQWQHAQATHTVFAKVSGFTNRCVVGISICPPARYAVAIHHWESWYMRGTETSIKQMETEILPHTSSGWVFKKFH